MLSCVLPVSRYTVPRRSKASPHLFHQKETALVEFCDDEVHARTNPHPNPSDSSRRPPVPLTIGTNAAATAAAADLQRRYSSPRRLDRIRFSLRRRPPSLPACRCRRRRFRRGRYGGIRRRRTRSAGRSAGPTHRQHVIYRRFVARGCVMAELNESRNNKGRRTSETSTHCYCCAGLSSCAY